MINPSKSLTVTAVGHPNGVITAFLDELPGLVVQGNSMDDVNKKMVSLLESYAKRLESLKDNFQIHQTSLA